MIELPQATYQEYSNYSKWNYVDENGTFYNENDPQDYVYFDSTLNLIPLPNNETEVPWASSITMPNFLTYATFYSLTHSQPPFYMLPAFFDVALWCVVYSCAAACDAGWLLFAACARTCVCCTVQAVCVCFTAM